MRKITTDKAYIIGLIIGGGRIDNNTLQITLPYKKWGDLAFEPERAGGIAGDILMRLNPILSTTYGMETSYTISKDWKIRCTQITETLKKDLVQLALPSSGEMRLNANLKGVIPALKSDEHKKRFIAGLVDTVGSLAKSHRRFNDAFQIISFEFKGDNFELVKDVANIFHSLECPPDQILWNHPNQHSGTDRYYRSWKKGFKIRVSLADYIFKGSFVFESKKLSATENSKQHKGVTRNKKQIIQEPGRITLHKDQNAQWLPEKIRGGLYLHNIHFNGVFGVKIETDTIIKNFLCQPEKYFCPFTCLTKGTREEIDKIINLEEYLKQTTYHSLYTSVNHLLDQVNSDSNYFYGNTPKDGFPQNYVLQAVAYIIAAPQGKTRGKKVSGNYKDILNNNLTQQIQIQIPDRGTCLRITANGFSTLIGYVNEEFNKTLITSSIGSSKITVREPTFIECVKL